jgi:N-glycosylase/DNA lyase
MAARRFGLETSRLKAPEFDLALTLNSGQVFHWRAEGAGFAGAIGDQAVYVEPRKGSLLVAPGGAADLVRRYFALDHPLAEIRRSFPADDAALATAAASCGGLRIIRQPFWECTATFITSAMKQVAHIRQISESLRWHHGLAVRAGDLEARAYPTPAALAALTESDLRACGLGFRAAKLRATAQRFAAGEILEEDLRGLPRAEAELTLRALPGVGPKVANCVLLFALEHLDAFPIDVWIERVLRERYFRGKRGVTPARLREFSQSHFGPYGGYAQQYLFHHARTERRRGSSI